MVEFTDVRKSGHNAVDTSIRRRPSAHNTALYSDPIIAFAERYNAGLRAWSSAILAWKRDDISAGHETGGKL